jgi:hypothetical protein
MAIGDEHLGEFAREQMDSSRRDPRLERGSGAMIGDCQQAFEEAERVRELGVWGLFELRDSLEREEQRFGVSRGDETLSADDRRRLQAAWERAEMARIEIAKEHPHLHGQALLSMVSAVDAMVEELAPSYREMLVAWAVEQLIEKIREQFKGSDSQPSGGELDEIRACASRALLDGLPDLPCLGGGGIERYERVLRACGLGAPKDRPIPEELALAVNELLVIRNVLMHRAGRVDSRALNAAGTLRYEEGQLVRITRQDYRTYSAAARCYSSEIEYRVLRISLKLSEEDAPDLAGWRGYCRINA